MTVIFHKSCNFWPMAKVLVGITCLLIATHGHTQSSPGAQALTSFTLDSLQLAQSTAQLTAQSSTHLTAQSSAQAPPAQLLAQAEQPENVESVIDTTPPVIVLDELANGVADSSQVFTVQVIEDTELQDVTLFYRRAGEQAYTSALMSPLGTRGLYTVSLSTEPSDLLDIEYYVQARDAAGNRTVSGFAFDPYIRSLAPATLSATQPAVVEEPVASAPPSAQPTPFFKRRWVQVTLGVVAVGLLAGALSIDDDGDDTRIVPVTFTLENP